MDTKKIIALVLLGLFAVVLLENKGILDGVSVKILFTSIRASLSMVLLGTMALGVSVGILIK
jgi:hypothetical protein